MSVSMRFDVLYSICFFLTLVMVPAPGAYAESFDNFGNTVTLERLEPPPLADESLHYFITEDGTQLAVSNRIIARVNRDSTTDLTKIGLGVEHQEMLARLDNTQLVLLYLAPEHSVFTVIPKILAIDSVQSAQPDFLQLTARRSFSGQGIINAPDGTIDPLTLFESVPDLTSSQGEGVKIAIIDDGFDLQHPAFHKTVNTFSYDVDTRTPTAAPRITGDKHGTMVAGILFADFPEAHLAGITPKAELIAIRHTQNWTSDTLLALYLAHLAEADVINCSWGMPILLEPMADLLNFLSRSGRKGLGLPVVFAAGNEGEEVVPNQSIQTHDAVISVSAVDRGQPVGNTGEAVDIFAQAGVRTVDYRDYSRTVMLAKTSSSAPIVTGAIALMFAQHPNLSLEELRTLLKTSSNPIAQPFEQDSGILDIQAAERLLRSNVENSLLANGISLI